MEIRCLYYFALIDGDEGAFGVSFPDLPGCVAMGDSVDEALSNAQEALRAWVEGVTANGGDIPKPSGAAELSKDGEVREALAEGAILARVLLVRELGRPVKANMSIDSGVLAEIDATADRLGITRSALVERLAKECLPAYA
jgi:predicted RNase H-like HicB family nuclease